MCRLNPEMPQHPYLTLGAERVIAVSVPDEASRPIHGFLMAGIPSLISVIATARFSLRLFRKPFFKRAQFELHTVYEERDVRSLKARSMAGDGVARNSRLADLQTAAQAQPISMATKASYSEKTVVPMRLSWISTSSIAKRIRLPVIKNGLAQLR